MFAKCTGDERRQRVRHQVAAGRAKQPRRALSQDRGRRKDRKAGQTECEVQHLAGGAEASAKGGRADEHDHWLKCERHRRKWQRQAHLRGRRGEDRHEQHGAGLLGPAQRARRGAERQGSEQGRLHERGS